MNFITVRRHDGNCHATRKDTDDSSVAVDATFDRNPTPRRSYPLGLSCMSDEHRVLSPVVLQQSETPVFLLTHGGSHSLQRQPSLDPHSSQQQHMPLPLPIQYTPPPKFGQHMALLQGALLIQQLTQPRVEGTLGVHSLTRLSSQLSQSSQLGEDQVLLCQAPYQQEQPTDLMTKPIPAPSSLPEDGSSNAGYMVLATHKHDKGNGEYEDETGPEVQKKTKRPRNALQLQERLEIIDFREKNQHMSMYTISEKFGVPRSTIYGIIKDKDRLKKLTASGASNGLTLERKSSVESPFHLLEELLVAWSGDLGERGFVVTDKKTTAQAFEIHRMLYGIVSKPLPSCEFTLGWIQRFKKRRNWSTLAAREASDTIHQADSWSFPEDLLRRLPTGLDDVFMCGMVSMYLDVLPTRVYATSSQESETTIQDSPIASVLLCCNATGTSLRAPYVSGRGIHTDKIPQEYSRDKDVDAGMEDLTASELAKWLEDFDKELDRSIVLILDRSTWSLLQPKPEGHDGQDPLAALNARLKNIVISKVPKTHDAFHPMAAGLGQEFKLLYLCFLLGLDVDVDKRAMFREETTFVNRLSFIRHAWFSVRESIINRSFETVEASLRNWAGHHQLSLESSIWSKNAKVLPLSRGTIIDEDPRRHPLPRDRTNLIDNDLSREVRNAFPSAPDTVIQYYLTQEAEIGPSYFLRNKVREMQHHKDFEGCFRSDSDQARRFEAPAHPIYGKSRHDGGNNATGLDKDDTLTLEIHSCRNVASCLSESHGAALGAILSNLSSQIGNTVVADEMTHHNPPSTDSVGSQWTLPSSGEQQNSSTADLEHGNITSSEECREWDDELDALRAVLCPEVRHKIPTKGLRGLKRVNVCTG
ncbi:MAG: hypothetical protein J3Q66DRAFT_68827 [Benniella sp.]|nr:MAG: hypothetical protein J3Q66DRAFT_68827 [Benniella sp.]